MQCRSNYVRNVEKMLTLLAREMYPMVRFCSGNHERVANGEGINRHECDAGVVLPDKGAGNLATNDARKDGCHVLKITLRTCHSRADT